MQATLTILLVITTTTLSATQPCTSELSVELKDRKYNGVTYNDGEYFVDENGIERGCICMKGICSRKCCPFGQIYDAETFECLNHSKPFNPPVWTDYEEVKGFNASKEFQFISGMPNCSKELNEVLVFVYPAIQNFRLNTDGTLYLGIPDQVRSLHFTIFHPDKFCIDNFIHDEKPGPDGTALNGLICSAQPPDNNQHVLSSTCMLISCFFILLTVGVYAWLPELRNLHGMVLMAYLLSFFAAFLSLTTMKILILKNMHTATACVVLSFFIYYFLLVAFFWLNVMCYDLWYTFSGKRGTTLVSSIRARFLKYCAYTFGVPTLLTVILAALEFSDPPLTVPLMPRLRRNGCFLYKESKTLYLYGPITIVCVMNLIFFILTAFKIAKIKRQTKEVLNSNESSTNDQHKKDQQRLSVYIKLFAVMGFSWILEVVSGVYPEADTVWQFTDAYNVLVGLILFIIFVCKKKILIKLKNRSKEFFRGAKTDEVRDITMKIQRRPNNQTMRERIDTLETLADDLDNNKPHET